MKAIYGKKLGMTRVFNEAGESIPVTVLEVSPNVVYQVKTPDKDGYSAIQVGYGTRKARKTQKVNRPETGHFAKAKKGMPRYVKEIRLDKHPRSDSQATYEVGQEIKIDGLFEIGARVDVFGTSIGKGFAGVMKRHHMAGFKATHGTHEVFRHGGSIGCRKFPGRVFKNKRMAGHMGAERVVQQGLEIVAIRAEENALLVRGSVPGHKGAMVFVCESIKA